MIDTAADTPVWCKGKDEFLDIFSDAEKLESKFVLSGFGKEPEIVDVYRIPDFRLSDGKEAVTYKNLVLAVTDRPQMNVDLILPSSLFDHMKIPYPHRKQGGKTYHTDAITLEKAFEWFEQDVIDHEKYAKRYFTPTKGEYKDKFRYDEFPISFKEALIDIAFNRGTGVMASETIYDSLRANFRDGADNMPAAAVRTRQETFKDPDLEGGLRKRNVYRFLLAIRSLSGEYKLIAMRRFDRDEYDKNGKLVKSYLSKTFNLLSAPDRKQLQTELQ